MIPHVDLDGMADSHQQGVIFSQLGDALTTYGAAYVSHHGIERHVLEGAYDACEMLHMLDVDTKRTLAVGTTLSARGWHEGTRTGKGSYETFEIGPEPPARLVADDRNRILYGPNIWPELSGFRERASTYFSALHALSMRLLVPLEAALGLPDRYLQARAQQPCTLLRMLRYEPSSDQAPGIAAHTDFELFTLISENAPGLEVCGRDGTWRAVTTDGIEELVILAGDLLEVVTAGAVESPLHRVGQSRRDRCALAFFMGLDPDQVLVPRRSRSEGSVAPRYERLNVGDHLTAMYVLSYPHLRAAHASGMLGAHAIPEQNPFKAYKIARLSHADARTLKG